VSVLDVEPAVSLRGDLAVPGDKSITHRALLLGAIADGDSSFEGLGLSEDTLATARAVEVLGARVELDGDRASMGGVGLRGLRAPDGPIDCGNAGTLMRLLPGILAGQEGRFELVGDESLSGRPLDRVAEPLSLMGAGVETTEGHAPLIVGGHGSLEPIRYELPVASAQVKSCVLLAGLYASHGRTEVIEPAPTRDHTERMLNKAGARITIRPSSITIRGADRLSLGDVEVPGDFSSAAPFVVAATLVPGSELHVHGVNLNPRRTGLLEILERMGAKVTVYNRREIGGEPAGDLEIRSAALVGTTVGADEVPLAIDELPLFALAAASARGDSVLRGAAELRAKETDRIEATVDALRVLGVRARARDDGFTVTGVPARLRGGRVASRGDHRLAMLGAVAGLASRDGVRIDDAEVVSVSFPGFFEMLAELRRTSAVEQPERR
jgi:3-phosphoshikimate 1-carboxyvinyltransferase